MKAKDDVHVHVLRKGFWQDDREPSDAKALKFVEPYPTPFASNSFYTPKEIAKELRVTVDTVYGYINDGKIEAQPLPKGYVVSGCKVNAFLEQLRIRRMKK